MIAYPHIDPVALQIGPLQVHWYGLMYVIGISATWYLARKRVIADGHFPCNEAQVEDLIFYVALGLVVGGRIGYTFFYNMTAFLHDPVLLFRVWEGGMSFHGGLMGGVLGGWLYARVIGVPLLDLMDLVFRYVPIGLFAGRIGNFINGELWGAPTSLPWGMIFPAADGLPRHPSQLYEAGGEGILLGFLLYLLGQRRRSSGYITGVFFTGYAVIRFLVEFIRVPDAQIGYLLGGWLTMGQVLTIPVFIFGGLMIRHAIHHPAIEKKIHVEHANDIRTET